MERGEFASCGSPTGMDSRDPYDLHLGKRCSTGMNVLYMGFSVWFWCIVSTIGARMLYNPQDMLWRRKLEEQADLQQALELQNRRLMGLQLLDVKRNSHHRTLSSGAVISSPTNFSPTFFSQNVVPGNRSSPEAKEGLYLRIICSCLLGLYHVLILTFFMLRLQRMAQLGWQKIMRCIWL